MKEEFKISKNPFCFTGVIGRLDFFAFSALYIVLNVILLLWLCPGVIDSYTSPMAPPRETPLGLAMLNAPSNEIFIFVLMTIIFTFMFFILNKKRILDIIGQGCPKKPSTLKQSIIYSAMIFIINTQVNFFSPVNSLQAKILFWATMVITLFLFFKKGIISSEINQAEKMKQLKLNTGCKMPILGLGTWKSEKGQVYNAIREAIKIGYRHFDCAAAYYNEEEVGNAIADAIKDGDVSRKELFITSKLWNDAHKAEDVIPALQKTLSDLKLEYLDLYLVHWAVALKKDTGMNITPDSFVSLEETPLSETWKAMEEAVSLGLVKSIGVSNYNLKNLEEMKDYAKIMPAVNQVESHPFLAQNELIEYAKKNGIVITAYAPLASRDRPDGMKNENEPALLEHPVVLEIAEKYKATPAQILIAWQINRNVVVIPKSVSAERLQENYDAKDINLKKEDMEKLAELNKGYRYINGAIFVAPEKGYTTESIWG